MTELIDGKKIADEILADLAQKVATLRNSGRTVRLTVLVVGEHPASISYIKKKQDTGKAIGIEVSVLNMSASSGLDEVRSQLLRLAKEIDVCGTIIQLPLPEHLEQTEVLDLIDPGLDVDCLTSVNRQKLMMEGNPDFFPPAPLAILKILEYHKIDLAKLDILIAGSGDLVGKPLAAMLLHKGISFVLANKYTDNLPVLAQRSDLIIAGTGQKGLITGDMVKDDAIIVDAGTAASEDGVVYGDVDTDSVLGRAALLSPVPGGVGPVTVAMLLKNTVQSAYRKHDLTFDNF